MIDSHCHLDFDAFDGRREQAIRDANRVGVHTIINIGVDIPTSERSIELAEQYEAIYATIGIHPHDAKILDDQALNQLRRLATHPKVVAIGEIGLDYYRNLSPHEVQKTAFQKQLELAAELNKPVVIHTRESFRDTVDIVTRYADRLPGGIFHCFPGTVEDAYEVIAMGFVISVGGVITFNKAKMATVAAEVPLDKIVLETDSPYLTPVPFRGKQNQPAYVSYVYKKLAELRNLPLSEVETQVDRTCQKVYRLVETFEG